MAGNGPNKGMNSDSRPAFLLGRMETTATMPLSELVKNISRDPILIILILVIVGIPSGIALFVYLLYEEETKKRSFGGWLWR